MLNGSQDCMNPFTATRGDKSSLRPFAKLIWTLVSLLLHKLGQIIRVIQSTVPCPKIFPFKKYKNIHTQLKELIDSHKDGDRKT